jgi:predicted RNase H-like nuclease
LRFLGIDLAWRDGTAENSANQTGVVALESSGEVVQAGWTVGLEETREWLDKWAKVDCLALIDAPLVVNNKSGLRLCEREVSQRYMHPWKVGANSTNASSPRLGGVRLRELLEEDGWRYDDGTGGPPAQGRNVSECYPFTTIVGVEALGYEERPMYKRNAKKLPAAQWRKTRAANCDELIRRVSRLREADPPLLIDSHLATRRLVDEPSPESDAPYKSREDLLDALISAWTAALWARHGLSACQVLGAADGATDAAGRRATIIAPAREAQRRT